MYYTALIMGLAGSLHCAGMCSPLAMAVTRNKPFLASKIVYNTGRILTYGVLGGMVAVLGSFVNLSTYQQALSIVLGSIFVLLGIGGMSRVRIPFVTSGMEGLSGWLKKAFGKFLQRKSLTATFIMGTLNGLLPCGLTYLALTACLLQPNALDGFLFMLVFGLGTWPVMIGISWVMNLSFLKSHFNLARFSKIALIFVGCLLFLRVWWSHPHPNESSLFGKVGGTETVCEE
jgi:sulfite exporter TauE/SafE